MKRLLPICGLTVLAGAVLLLNGCAAKKKEEAQTTSDVAVAVAAAELGDIPLAITITGPLQSEVDVLVPAKRSGRVKQVTVREGDRVTTGQVLVQQESDDAQLRYRQAVSAVAMARARYQKALTGLELEPTTTNVSIRTATAALDAARARLRVLETGARPQERQLAQESVVTAEANLKNAKANLERTRSLYARDAVGKQTLDAAETAFEVAQAQLSQARQNLSLVKEGPRSEEIDAARATLQQAEEGLKLAEANRAQRALRQQDVTEARAALVAAETELHLAKLNLEYTTTKAPVSGLVAARMTEPGQNVGDGAPVMRIVDLNRIYLEARVSEMNVRQIKPGQPAEITVDAYPDARFSGTVSRIYPVGNEASRDFTVRINMHNGHGQLKPEMFARGRILVSVHRNVTIVPKDALVTRDTGQALFVVRDKIAKETPVTLGYLAGNSAEVKGIKPGDKVVVQGQENITDGDRVKVEQVATE